MEGLDLKEDSKENVPIIDRLWAAGAMVAMISEVVSQLKKCKPVLLAAAATLLSCCRRNRRSDVKEKSEEAKPRVCALRWRARNRSNVRTQGDSSELHQGECEDGRARHCQSKNLLLLKKSMLGFASIGSDEICWSCLMLEVDLQADKRIICAYIVLRGCHRVYFDKSASGQMRACWAVSSSERYGAIKERESNFQRISSYRFCQEPAFCLPGLET